MQKTKTKGLLMDIECKKLGERIRQVRQKMKHTQTQAAQACGGYRTDTWSRIERGDSETVPVELLLNLIKYAQQAGVALDWLFCGNEEREDGKTIRRHGFNYVDVVADRAFMERATFDEIAVQLGRNIRNRDMLEELLKCTIGKGDRKKLIEGFCKEQEKKND